MKSKSGITLIALVVTIIVLLILAGITVSGVVGKNGIVGKANEAKILQAIGTIKEELELEELNKNKKITPETLLAENRVIRTVQQGEEENYYMYYVLKEDASKGMQGLGKGNIASLKDVFLIDDNLNVEYIDKSGKKYGNNINKKILEDETEIKFSSSLFSDYISKISGIPEDEMKFKWMKNQTSLVIADASITSLEDLIFFPNLISLQMGVENGDETKQLTLKNLDGIENCSKLQKISIFGGSVDDYTKLSELNNLQSFFLRGVLNNFDNLIKSMRNLTTLTELKLVDTKISSMKKIEDLSHLSILEIKNSNISSIEGVENCSNMVELRICSSRISKIQGIDKLDKLQDIDLSYNKIEDITPLAANTQLLKLNLKGNSGIKADRSQYTQAEIGKLNKIGGILERGGSIFLDIDKIKLFSNYKVLDLSYQNLSTLKDLEGMTELVNLNLANNQLTLEDIESQEILKSMKNLKELTLDNNNLKSIKVINELSNLTSLSLRGTIVNLQEIEDIISSLNPVRVGTDTLKTIENCSISKITKLSLSYSYNQLRRIPDLSKFTNLVSLRMTGNSSVENIEEISKISSLELLDLAKTELHGKMIDFSKLTNLKILNLSQNTLWSEDLENLKALKYNSNLSIDLKNNSIVNANALLELKSSTTIDLAGNINLLQNSKDKLKEKFGGNVRF